MHTQAHTHTHTSAHPCMHMNEHTNKCKFFKKKKQCSNFKRGKYHSIYRFLKKRSLHSRKSHFARPSRPYNIYCCQARYHSEHVTCSSPSSQLPRGTPESTLVSILPLDIGSEGWARLPKLTQPTQAQPEKGPFRAIANQESALQCILRFLVGPDS